MTMLSMRARDLLVASLAVMGALAPGNAQAQVLFDNGVPDNYSGLPTTGGSWIADNFILGSSATVSSFSWHALRFGTGGATTLTTDYNWGIFANAAGTPGAILAGGSVLGGLA